VVFPDGRPAIFPQGGIAFLSEKGLCCSRVVSTVLATFKLIRRLFFAPTVQALHRSRTVGACKHSSSHLLLRQLRLVGKYNLEDQHACMHEQGRRRVQVDRPQVLVWSCVRRCRRANVLAQMRVGVSRAGGGNAKIDNAGGWYLVHLIVL